MGGRRPRGKAAGYRDVVVGTVVVAAAAVLSSRRGDLLCRRFWPLVLVRVLVIFGAAVRVEIVGLGFLVGGVEEGVLKIRDLVVVMMTTVGDFDIGAVVARDFSSVAAEVAEWMPGLRDWEVARNLFSVVFHLRVRGLS